MRSRFLIRAGHFFFRWRDAFSPLLFLSLLFLTRPGAAAASARSGLMSDLAGVFLAAAGQLLRVAVVGYAYIIRGGRKRKVYAEGLVTRGLFSVCRNPLYLGNLLIYVGLMIVWNSSRMYLVAVPVYAFMYASIVAAEEDFLLRKFGDEYERYCRKVNRWLPDVRRLQDGLEGIAFNWRRVVVKEYGTIAAWTLTAALLLVIERSGAGPAEGRSTDIAVLVVVMLGIVAVWGLARWLKLSGRLRVTSPQERYHLLC